MDHHWLWRRARLTSLVVASGLVLAACSTVGGDAAGAGSACDSPGVSPDEVKIGLVYPDTGSLAVPLIGVQGGIDARLGAVNAAGGVHGRTVSVDWRDDESTLQGNLKAVRELTDGVGVLGVIEGSAVVSDAATYLGDHGVPVTGFGLEPVWSEHPNMFPVLKAYSDGTADTTFGKYVRASGGSRALVLVDPRDTAAHSVAGSFTASLRSQNVEIVSEVQFSPGVNDPDRVVTTMVDQNVDTLISAASPEILASVLSAAHARGVQLKAALGLSGYDQRMLDAFHAGIAGMSINVPYEPFEQSTPAIDAYRAAMATYAPQVGEPKRQASILAYIAADLLVAGLEAAGDCPTREGVIQAMSNLSSYDADGLLATPLSLGNGSQSQQPCNYFVRVNPTGDAFDVVPGGEGPQRNMWCGERLPG